MEQYLRKLDQLLKDSGYSFTGPRKKVFEILYKYGLQTTSQLVERTSSVDRASVYRTIEVFEKIGAINRITQGFKYKLELSDTFLPHHHHISCVKCGKQKDVEQSNLENLLETIAIENGYTLKGHKVELQGLCGNCRIKNTP